jgi:hypothetical protein
MKLNFVKFVAIAGVLAGGSLTASAAEHIRVNVPFSFVVAGLQFQPGQYTLDENTVNGVITVQGGGRGAAVLTVPGESAKAGSGTSLRFVTDGKAYHLVSVQVEGETARAVNGPTYQEHKLAIASR